MDEQETARWAAGEPTFDAMTHAEKQRYYKEKAARKRAILQEKRQKELEALQKQQKEKDSRSRERFMREALKQAQKACELGEVPIGCVIVKDGKILARGYNRRNSDHSVLAHAEIAAIRKACRKTGDWRLEGCSLYVTLEPCQMCTGAILQARIGEVVMGCPNPRAGCAGSVLNLLETPAFHLQVQVHRGVLESECSDMLSRFFREMRRRRKEEVVANLE